MKEKTLEMTDDPAKAREMVKHIVDMCGPDAQQLEKLRRSFRARYGEDL